MAQLPATQTNTHLMQAMAEHYSLDREEFLKTVRATCGMVQASPEEMAAFLIVCKTYDLNPITREIYAFPRKGGGVVPIVSIDGWVNMVNSHPQCDGFEFEDHHDAKGELESITCRMHRKDRKFPVTVTEYLQECIRGTEPWKMKHRMLRHKALIQAARYAFGFAGVYDEDEGRVIADAGPNGEPRRPPPATPPPAPQIEHKPEAEQTAEQPHDQQTGEVVEEKAPQTTDDANQPTAKLLAAKAAAPYLEAIAKHATAETLASWQKAHKAEFDAMPDPAYQMVADAYKARKAALTKQAKASISSGTTDKPKPAPKAAKVPNVEDPAEYEAFVEWANKLMDESTNLDALQTFFNGMIEDNRKHLMPPDFDGLQEVYGRNEQRLKRAAEG